MASTGVTQTAPAATNVITGSAPQIFEGVAEPGLEGTVFDTSGTIATGTSQEETMAEEDPDRIDPAYEFALKIGGAEFAENYRGSGLIGVLPIQEDFDRLQAESALRNRAVLAPQEQFLDNRLREDQKQEDLDLIGRFGEPYRDALRGLSPEQTALAQRSFDFSEQKFKELDTPFTQRELQEAKNAAYMSSASTGSQDDPTAFLRQLAGLQDAQGTREREFMSSLTDTYNIYENLDSGFQSLLLGGSPQAGQTVTPSVSSGDVYNMGLIDYANTQDRQEQDAAIRRAESNLRMAEAAGEPDAVEKALADLKKLNSTFAALDEFNTYLSDIPGTINKYGGAIQDTFEVASNLPIVGGIFGAAGDITGSVTKNLSSAFSGKSSNTLDRIAGLAGEEDKSRPFHLKRCWVAREVYGEDNPKWLQFRDWVTYKAPAWFRNSYDKYGERFAQFISNKPRTKELIRKWMDTKIK